MSYFDINGAYFSKKNMQYLSSGQCASICHNKEIVFKEYFSDTLPNCRLSPKMFDILKSINNKHFIKLFNIYSDMNLIELIEYKTNIRKFFVDAYTAEYYSDDSVNVLYESIDYILENFSELEKLFNIFTDNSIITDDVKRQNTILSHNGIIIIDPDTFYISSLPSQDISIENKKEILTLFRSICTSNIKDMENHNDILKKINLDLADIEINNNTNVTYEIFKKLKYVKKPIDYLIK